jgi:hypothetical protein
MLQRYVGENCGRAILWASTMKMFDKIDRTLSFRPNPDPFLMKHDLQQNVDSTPVGTT